MKHGEYTVKRDTYHPKELRSIGGSERPQQSAMGAMSEESTECFENREEGQPHQSRDGVWKKLVLHLSFEGQGGVSWAQIGRASQMLTENLGNYVEWWDVRL